MPSRRVLLAMIEPPLPFGNAAGRWFHVLYRGLVERGHDVTAFASYSNPRDAESARELFPSPAFDLRLFAEDHRPGLASKWRSLRRPYSYLFSPAFQAEWEREVGRGCEVIHLEQSWTGRLAGRHAAKSLVHIHYLFAIDQADAAGGGLVERIRRSAVLRSERSLIRSLPNISTLTDRLTESVRAINPSANLTTIPLGMDATLYPFPPLASDHPPTVVLIGSFGWRPTKSAGVRLLTRLWPSIRREVPEARLHLVGRDAGREMAAFAGTPGLQVFENVPDTAEYFRTADVMLYAPERGSGMKVKVLEAFALGTPVVTTWEGVEGIPAVDGIHAGVAEDDEGLIARTVALLRDPAARTARRAAARALLESHCGPKATVDAVEAAHERIIAANRSGAGS